MRIEPVISLIVVIALIVGCSSGMTPEYSCFRSVSPSGWSRDYPLEFNLGEDSMLTKGGPYDLSVVVRNTERCNLRTLWLAVETIGYDATMRRDTIGVNLCDSLGSWTGNGSHGIYESVAIVRRKFKLPQGMDVTVTPADTASEVKGISDIGLILTSTLNN